MNNPLLQKFETPYGATPFDKIENEHFLPALKEAIKQAWEKIDNIKNNKKEVGFDNVIVALENSDDLVQTIAEIFGNLRAAEMNDGLQSIAKEFSSVMTKFFNDVILDKLLFEKIKTVNDEKEDLDLTPEQKTLLEKTYKTYIRNGALLTEEKKERLREIDKRISELGLEFGDHVLAETNAYMLEITDRKDLAGLPDSLIEAAEQTAKEKGKEGSWVITLDFPSYVPFMKYADNRELRQKLFRAYHSKSFKGDENDNQNIILEMVKLRHERANLLGYKTHADFVLEERMAEDPTKVWSFLDQILSYSKPAAEAELKELKEFVREIGGNEDIQYWDFPYYGEKLRKKKYDIDDEILRPYFKLEKVIDGVFNVANRLYGITFEEVKGVPVYHQDVKVYEIKGEGDTHVGLLYGDFFPRAGKRNGAWMTWYRAQKKNDDVDQRPHVSIVCNFTKPTPSKPSLLTFGEVKTFFHEFGHALHGIMSNCHYRSLAGPNVYWDFVELPSQIMENWCFEKECLDQFASHYETGEKIPEELIKKIKESSNFHEGWHSVRQTSFGLIDMAWHNTHPDKMKSVSDFEKVATEKTRLFPIVDGINFSCSFSHIFQGSYSSGYYSYKWAEVLDADAFELFKEKGIFNKEVASNFLNNILSRGGTEHPMTLYKRFRGKEPSIEPLLKRSGLLDRIVK